MCDLIYMSYSKFLSICNIKARKITFRAFDLEK